MGVRGTETVRSRPSSLGDYAASAAARLGRSPGRKGRGEVSRKGKCRVFREVKPHPHRNLPLVKMAKHGIPDHCLQMRQIIPLCGNPAAARIIPGCREPAGFLRSHSENDFLHVWKCRRDGSLSQAGRRSRGDGRNLRLRGVALLWLLRVRSVQTPIIHPGVLQPDQLGF